MAAKRIVPGPHGSPVSDSQESGESALLAGAAEGDEAAFRSLVERHLSGLLVLARRMLRDDAEAEDVTQEALLKLWRSREALEVGVYGLRPWLRRVVSNLCIDKMRSSRRFTVTDDVPEQAEPADQLTQVEKVLVISIQKELLPKALELASDLRKQGVATHNEVTGRSVGSALSYADKKNYRYAVLVGSAELERQCVILRDLKAEAQREVPIANLFNEIGRS